METKHTIEELEEKGKQFGNDINAARKALNEFPDLMNQFKQQAIKRMEPVENIKSQLNGSKIEATRTRGGFIIIGFEKEEVMKDLYKWLQNGGNFNSK